MGKIDDGKHTPTPWQVQETAGKQTIREIEGYLIATVWKDDLSEGIDKKDAQFIVHAVNTHDALLKASKELLGWCKKSLLFNSKFLESLEIAIALAEGKAEKE